jgi:hypothetical protein
MVRSAEGVDRPARLRRKRGPSRQHDARARRLPGDLACELQADAARTARDQVTAAFLEGDRCRGQLLASPVLLEHTPARDFTFEPAALPDVTDDDAAHLGCR